MTVPFGVFDLSGDNNVRCGRFQRPPSPGVPFVWYAGPSISSERGGPSMGRYRRRASFDMVGYAPVATDDVGVCVEQSIRLQHDCFYAIEESARGTIIVGTTINSISAFHDLWIESIDLSGDENALAPGYAMFMAVIHVEYATKRGI